MPHKKQRRATVKRSRTSPAGPTSRALLMKMAFAPQDLLTDVEAAAFLRLQPHTLRVWRTANRQPGLRFIRLGRSIRYQFADLLAFTEKSKSVAA